MLRAIFILSLLLSLSVSKELEKVSLQLHWLDQFQFAGYYMAKEKGYYKNAGLEVDIKKFNNNIFTTNEVVNKKANYAVGRSGLVAQKALGADIKLLTAIFQSTPLVLISTDPKIKTIQDTVGKRVMMTKDLYESRFLTAMLSKKNIIIQNHTFNIDDLINKKTDLMASYISNEPFVLSQKGINYTLFRPQDYGFDSYSDLLFTSSDEIKNHKQRAINFTNASLMGWEYAFNNIEETVDIILKKYNTQNKTKKALIYEAIELKKLAYYKTKRIGYIDKNKIQNLYQFYKREGVINNTLDLDEFIVYNNKDHNIELTKKEKEFLSTKKELKVCVREDWLPYSGILNNKFVGIGAEYLSIVSQKLDIPLNIVPVKSNKESVEFINAGKCDIKPLSLPGSKIILSTKPYLDDHFSLVTSIQEPFIYDLNDYIDKKFVVLNQHIRLVKYIKKQYPAIKLINADNINKALKMVVQGEAFGFIDKRLSSIYHIQKYYSSELKVINQFNKINICMAVKENDHMLLNILQKGLDSIREEEKIKIRNNWIVTVAQKQFDYSILWYFASIVILIASAFSYRHYLLDQVNKRLKTKVEEKTKELNRYFETMDDALAVADRKTKKFSTCNKAFERLTGYTKQELKGMTIDNIHPKESLPHILEEFNRSTIDQTVLAKAIPVLNKNKKKIVLCDIKINSFKDDGKTYSIEVFRDITDRLYMESQLRELNANLEAKVKEKTKEQNLLLSLFDKGEVSLVRWNNDDNWSIKYISCNASIIFGYSNKELENKLFHFEDIIYKDDLQRVRYEVDYAVQSNADFFVHKPYRIVTEQGKLKWILDNTLIIRDINGNIIEYLGYITDVTELKAYELSLEFLVEKKTKENIKQMELLEQQSRLAQMGEMISMIAHQWRQPLSSISSTIVGLQIDLISNSYDLDKKEDQVKMITQFDKKFKSIEKYIKYLSETIDDFRNFFKPNKDKELIKITTPIKKALEIVGASMEKKGVNIEVHFNTNDELYIYQNELMQVILNILKNSSDNFIEKVIFEPKITIAVNKQNRSYIITICDNGGGVETDILNSVFDPYFTTKDEKNGSGLGLYMSKIMVEEHHNGKLKVYNKDNGLCCELLLHK
ncbi:MAG: ABC transporter substrate-binding protein [Campylobacterota bacterium]|nr:ABC transporter substrate-binding protein [Campylobacterota bacterium]